MTNLDPVAGYYYDLYVKSQPSILIGRFLSLTITAAPNSDTKIFTLERGLIDLRAVGELSKSTNKYTPLTLKDTQSQISYIIEPDLIKEGSKVGRSQIINRIEGVIREIND